MAFTKTFKKWLLTQIKALRDTHTIEQMAIKLKVSEATVNRIIKEAKLPPALIQKISPERMVWLDKAAVQKGYKNFYDVPVKGPERDLIGQIATRRQTGVYEGYDAPKTKAHKAALTKAHWSKQRLSKEELKKITHSPKRLEKWAKETAPQRAILAEIEKGVVNSKQIAKNLGVSHKKLLKQSVALFNNVYTEKYKINKKGLKPASTYLPHTTVGLNKILNQLWQVKGFEGAEGRTWFRLIRNAREAGRLTGNQFDKANRNVRNFFTMKKAIQTKYPSLILNLDHPLSVGTLKDLGATGEKFLTGMPSTELFNKGLKRRLDVSYKNLIGDVRKGIAGAGEKKIALENLAKSLKIDIGEVSPTGKKAVSLGQRSIVLGDVPVQKGILQSLKEQNILAKNIKSVDPALAEAVGMDQYLKRVKLPEISLQKLAGVKKILNQLSGPQKEKVAIALGCWTPGKAEGGRVGYALGTGVIRCVNTKLTNEPVQSSMKLRIAEGVGKIKPAATSFLKMLGRGGLKAAPYAALAAAGAAAEPLVKKFMVDDPTTYLTDENQMKGMLLATIEGEPPKVDEEILKWQYPGMAASAAAAIPGSSAMMKARRAKGFGTPRAALGPVGKFLAGSFSPLGVAATLPLHIAAQRKGGTDWGDIATDPMNWMAPAFASSGAKMATRGMAPTGILAKAIRMGMSPRALMLGSRFLGWPGLALTAGMWGYDKWKNRDRDD